MQLHILQPHETNHKNTEPNFNKNYAEIIHISPPQRTDRAYVEANLSAIKFSKDSAQYINKISQPIFSFGIRIFTYCRIFNDGSFLYLSSNPEWVENYFNNNYQNDINHFKHYVPQEDVKYSFWSEFKMDHVFKSAYENFNYWHGVSLYERNDDYIDYFDFGSDKDNHKMGSFYLNNLSILSQFVQYFKAQAFKNLHLPDPTKSVHFENIMIRNQLFRRNFSKTITKNTVPEKHNIPNIHSGHTIVLSDNEKKCLHYLYQGKSVQEIGRDLNISYKTVVFYIHAIKLKAQNLTKSELLNALENDMNFSHIFSYSLTEKPRDSTEKSDKKLSRFYKKLISRINTYVISLIVVFVCLLHAVVDVMTSMLSSFVSFAHNMLDVIATMLLSTLTYCH